MQSKAIDESKDLAGSDIAANIQKLVSFEGFGNMSGQVCARCCCVWLQLLATLKCSIVASAVLHNHQLRTADVTYARD